MTEYLRQDEHERFKELSALSNSGTLSAGETAELSSHLQLCAACREIHEQYRLLAREGIPVLAAAFSEEEEDSLTWDSSATRKKLLARVRATEQESRLANERPSRTFASRFWNPAVLSSPRMVGTVAACLLLVVGVVGYQLGGYFETAVPNSIPSDAARVTRLELEKKSIETQLRTEEANRAQIEQDRLQKKEELVKVRARLRELENHLDALEAAKKEAAEQLQVLSQTHDLASAKLRDAEHTYQTEIATLRSERDKALAQSDALASRINELTVLTRDQERRLKEDEQYLASDRDIRELMGARKLYIADVFDVDSGSRTKKPSGRVFYTQGKSLIFYAFDLDRQSGVNTASIFQVWGQKDTAQEERARPMSLGILYMDSESNRRWVMRFDDPKQLAEIDAVFVTVEPRAGSQKPSSKPFLYALLRKEVNHP
jgi:hypothetical protein